VDRFEPRETLFGIARTKIDGAMRESARLEQQSVNF
jgi:hypothetical protein